MKTIAIISWLLLPLVGRSQGAFQNLNFESTTVPYRVVDQPPLAAADAFPGWTVWETNTVQTMVPYNTLGGDKSVVSLQAVGMGLFPYGTGLFSAQLVPYPYGNCALSQFGTIPLDATSLRYSTVVIPPPQALVVTFNGHVLASQVVWSQWNLNAIWTADISAYAGLAGELRFTASTYIDESSGLIRGGCYLDDIVFVPEPGVVQLLGLAGGWALWVGWRRRKVRG